jgi:hypothetical protein
MICHLLILLQLPKISIRLDFLENGITTNTALQAAKNHHDYKVITFYSEHSMGTTITLMKM